jgi:predicted hydrolase (HD superfamily)
MALESHVRDPYQREHARMVATALEGYAALYQGDADLWYITGLLHDIDFEQYPEVHPARWLEWFREWGYPEELIHAVEAHAYEYNGFTTLPQTKLAAALMACDELCGIFYAYRQLNPIPYGQMKASSIMKRLDEPRFAAKIKREDIYRGAQLLGVSRDEHVANMIRFLSKLDISI